jgi:hypothetical protein
VHGIHVGLRANLSDPLLCLVPVYFAPVELLHAMEAAIEIRERH